MKYQAFDKVYRDYLKEKEEDKKLFNCMINGLRYGFIVFFIIILISLTLSGKLVLAQSTDIDYEWNEVDLIDNAIYGEQALLNRIYPTMYIGENISYESDYLYPNSVALNYTVQNGETVVGDINSTYDLGGERLVIDAVFVGIYKASLDFNIFTHEIHNISEILLSYNISLNTTVDVDFSLYLENTQYNDTIIGTNLYGINETVNITEVSGYDVLITAFSTTSFTMYIDYLEFYYVPLVDKMEFAFNSTGSLINIGDDDVNNWTDIENDYYDGDVVNAYYSDDALDRSIRIFGYSDDWCGIERDDFGLDGGILYNVSWQFDLNEYGRGGHNRMNIDIEIYSYDLTKIFYLRLIGQSTIGFPTYDSGEIYWYDGSNYIYLQDQLPADNIDFNIFWVQSVDTNATLRIGNNSYTIPSLDYTKTGVGKIRIAGMVDDTVVSGKLDLEIDNIAIYIDGLPTSDDGFSTQLFYYLGVDAWSFNDYPFIEFDFDIEHQNNISVMLSSSFEVIAYDESFGLSNLWKNLYNTTNYPYPYFEIFNGSGSTFQIINVRIYGIGLVESSNTYFPSFTYNSVDIQDSYFYVENNQLQYSLETNDIYAEYIQLDFDIDDIYSRNRSFSVEHRKDIPNLFAEVRVLYTDGSFSYFESLTSLLTPNTILPQDKIIDKFQFIITDNDNDYNDVLTGYFSDISLIYYPNVDTLLPIINFIAIIPILVILLVIPLFLYIRFKMKWIFLPCVVIFAIIGTGSGIVPLWLTVVIIFSIISFYIISKKSSG